MPRWYANAGLARYAFLAGARVVRGKRRGQPVYPLPESRSRRLLAALQMLVVAVLLTPVATAVAALTLALVPACFWWDWSIVSVRRAKPAGERSQFEEEYSGQRGENDRRPVSRRQRVGVEAIGRGHVGRSRYASGRSERSTASDDYSGFRPSF